MVSDQDAGENADEFLMTYNLNGIRISEAAFRKLRGEISLQERQLDLPGLWDKKEYKIYSGLVPVGNDIFRKILVRASKIPQIDPRSNAFRRWTERTYYEVCSNPAIYAMLEDESAAGV
jgi:hypothetical protein